MIAACLKWVDHRAGVDPLTGAVTTDPRTSGASSADCAALEWALRLGEAWDAPVLALTAGPAAAEPVLRAALAAGAARAVRVEVAEGAPSEQVAAALAAAIPVPPDVVICGAWSTDRGSGAVPAFLAAHLGAAQALGLVTLAVPDRREPEAPGRVDAGRRELDAQGRLDGGRRERLRIPLPAVLSVEGGSARLRRAALADVLRAQRAPIGVVTVGSTQPVRAPARTAPFRPRPRAIPAPAPTLGARERILVLTGALVDRQPPRRLVLDPAAAAEEIIDRLREWGYLPAEPGS